MPVNRVVITQPTYLPWAGYFHLMAKADTFVFLDNVQFEKRSWQQRNRLKGPTGPVWLTVPVISKGRYEQPINQVEISGQSWQKQHLSTIRHLYAKAPYFHETFELLTEIYNTKWSKLIDLNLTIIRKFARNFKILPRFYLASDLQGKGKRVDLLLDLCQKTGATHYLSGLSAKNYIDQHNLFPQNNIRLEYQEFAPSAYPQLFGDFTSHLSIIDTSMNIGLEKTGALIKEIREDRNDC